MRSIHLILLSFFFVATGAPEAAAQRPKLAKTWYSDSHHGFELKLLDGWLITPVQSMEEALGNVIAQADGPDLATRLPGNKSAPTPTRIRIFKFEQRKAVTRDADDGAGGLRSRVESKSSRKQIGDFLQERLTQLRNFAAESAEEKKIRRGLVARHEVFTAFTGDYDIVFDCWSFPLDDFDVVLTFEIAKEHLGRWKRVFAQSAKTLRLIERTERVRLTDKSDYAQLLAYHADEVSRTPGWRLEETPTHRYLIKTSSDDRRFVKEMIGRLEKSRDLYERDFPPERPIDAVSVVRICSNAEEFHKYGKTGGGDGYGILGWFNPATEELVIYKAMRDPNQVKGVMSHEAFHQYCHFLFDRSEAHRWFDEGHGDYYGAFEFKGRKAIPHARMKGFSRLDHIRQQIREGSFTPVSEHVRMDHSTWQSSYGYPESWSLIYYLRRGMEGDVPAKLWRPEYADILENYIRILQQGFQDAYEANEAKVRADAKAAEEDISEEEVQRRKHRVTQEQKEEIWKQAIDGSWGLIEAGDPGLEKFTQNWMEYVLKHLRD